MAILFGVPLGRLVFDSCYSRKSAGNRMEATPRLTNPVTSTPPETAQQIDDQADQQNQSEPAATIGGSPKIKTAATEENQQDDDEKKWIHLLIVALAPRQFLQSARNRPPQARAITPVENRHANRPFPGS